MIVSSPSQVLIKTVDNRRVKATSSKGKYPVSGKLDSIEDLEKIVADLDKIIKFSNIHRVIIEGVDDIRYLVPWLQRENILGQASRLISSSELTASSLQIRKRCARLYLIIFSVYVILHDKRLQSGVLESLTTVSLCFDLLIGTHVNLYRVRPLEDSGRFSSEMSSILNQLMGLDEFMHEFDRLELFEEYQVKVADQRTTNYYIPPEIPAEYSIKIYIPKDSSMIGCSTPVQQQEQEPMLKKDIIDVTKGEKVDTQASSIDFPPFNFHLLKTNALSTFDVGVYSFLSTIRLHIYQDLLYQANKEHLLEQDIKRFQKVFCLLAYVNKDTDNKEVYKYLNQLLETISSLITYTNICKFIFEITESNPFSMSDIPVSCSTPRNVRAYTSTTTKAPIKSISLSLRNITAAIASCVQQMLQFISWVTLERPLYTTSEHTMSSTSVSTPRISCLFQLIYEKLLSLAEEISMCRASLCFTIFKVDEELVKSIVDDNQCDPMMTPYTLDDDDDDDSQHTKKYTIEYELLKSLYSTREDMLLGSKGIHATVLNNIDCSACYNRMAGEGGQIVIQFYGLLPQLLYCLLYLMNLANIMLPRSNYMRAGPIIQLIEPTALIITAMFNMLQQNNKAFCRTQLRSISVFLKRFSQAIEIILTTVHTASRTIYRRTRDSQKSSSDTIRMDAYMCVINTAFMVLQNMFDAGIVVLDQKLLVMGIRYISSFVSSKSFLAACRILMHLLPYKEMQEFADCYTLDGKPVTEYLIEKTRSTITDSACLNSLDTLLLFIANK